ncbi:MAG TPA: Fe-S cluster assembly protein SufD [Candidatus Limnocylindrales bacterium]|nr:Fe-S cluster assembly protein SufD [Candidatus Limnocylindrales bacterium]
MATTELTLPTFKGRPGWEFTDISAFDPARFAAPPGDAELIAPEPVLRAPEGAIELLQVDGATSEGVAIEDGPVVMPLSVALERHPELVEPHLGTVVDPDSDGFARANADGWQGGAFVYVPRGIQVEAPVLLTAVTAADATALHRRVLIVVEDNAEVEVWEQYLSADAGTETMLNTSVELVVGQNARLRYVSAQDLNERSWIFGSQRAEVARDGVLDWIALGFGSARGRVRMETMLAGEGAEGKVTGAYAPHARQHIDFDTTQEHAAANTTSDLAFRGILGGRSTAVWRGMIKVDPGAQRTDAFQECRNLLLSPRAHADAIPGLEILANDVRCTHAAAIAQLDRDQLFYLRSRGLPEGVATRLVIEGFMQEIVERFPEGALREAVTDALEHRLSIVLG